MIAFITQRISVNDFDQDIDLLELSYIEFYRSFFQMTMIPVANDIKNAQALAREITPELLILSGGDNFVYPCTDRRCLVEEFLFRFAIDNNIPVLAICRGMQFVNVFFGGTISQVSNHMGTHTVLSYENIYHINSYHEFGIQEKDLAKNFNALAISKDGVVEAFVADDMNLLAIQWHPERNFADQTLFRELCAKHLRIQS